MNAIPYLLSFLVGVILTYTPPPKNYRVVEVPILRYDTVQIRDTFSNTDYFSNAESYLTFCKYVKSQQSKRGDDQSAVIQVLYNRLRQYNCDWDTYYSTKKINRSESITKIRSGKWKIPFSLSNVKDLQLLIDVINYQYTNPLEVPSNVLYFHSHPEPWGRNHKGIWNPNKLYIKYTHKFYYR